MSTGLYGWPDLHGVGKILRISCCRTAGITSFIPAKVGYDPCDGEDDPKLQELRPAVRTIAEPQTGTNPHKTVGTVEHELGGPQGDPSRESKRTHKNIGVRTLAVLLQSTNFHRFIKNSQIVRVHEYLY